MTRYALVESSTVVNVIVWDGTEPYVSVHEIHTLPEDSPVSVGWTLEVEEWTPPPAEPDEADPESVAQEAARIAARAAAVEKLMALGLTEAEAFAIAGV